MLAIALFGWANPVFLTFDNWANLLQGSAILLIGGDKTGDDRWYDVNVPAADRLYDEHLEQLRKEGLING